MAKRAPAGEATYNPLDGSLAQSVIKPSGIAQEGGNAVPVGSGNQANENARRGPYPPFDSRLIPLPDRPKPVPNADANRWRGFSRAKRVLITPEEERHIERLVDRLAEQVGASLKLSHVLRACMAVLCHAEAEIMRQANAMSPLVRPANGDAVALAQFEQGVAKLLSLALREAPPLR
jgi:hypothetical protein